MHSWTDLQVDLSELVVAHLVYMNLSFHGHSSSIQCDISILLKSIEICKSQVVATLCWMGVHFCHLACHAASDVLGYVLLLVGPPVVLLK